MRTLQLNKSRWSHTTPLLWFSASCIVYTFGDLLFGVDTGSFGSLQALPSFLNRFGQTIGGKKALSTQRKSTMNSVVWIGKLAGTMVFEPILESIGYRWTIYLICAIQAVAIIVELTAHNWIVFSIGRVIAYLAVGMVENAVPNYTSEICPVPVRGFFTGSLLLVNTVGNVWGSGLSRAYATETTNKGWMIPTGTQLIPAIVLVLCVPFTPESPRWLVSKGKREEALVALNRIRPQREVDAGLTVAEVEAIEQSVEEAKLIGTGSWFELFQGTHLRRTMIATWLCIFEQSTGSQFVVSYQATFFVTLGLGARSFTYTTVNNAVCVVACFIAMIGYDTIGRRPIIIGGGFGQILFMLVIAGLGGKAHPSSTEINGVITCVILFFISVKVSYSANCFVMGAEIGGIRLRKKTLAWAIGWDIIAACIWTVAIPYMLGSPGANLGPKVGYVFAAISAAAFVFAVLFVPELKGRSLEETDELFSMRLWAWQFDKAETTGVGRRIALLEQGDDRADTVKGGINPVEGDIEMGAGGKQGVEQGGLQGGDKPAYEFVESTGGRT